MSLLWDVSGILHASDDCEGRVGVRDYGRFLSKDKPPYFSLGESASPRKEGALLASSIVVQKTPSCLLARGTTLAPRTMSQEVEGQHLKGLPSSQEMESWRRWSGVLTSPYLPRQLWLAWEKQVLLFIGARWVVVSGTGP